MNMLNKAAAYQNCVTHQHALCTGLCIARSMLTTVNKP